MGVTKWIVCWFVSLLVIVVCSIEAAERKSVSAWVRSGGEVLVADHKNFDKNCQSLPVPTVKITRQPLNGTVDVREGTFVIRNPWHPDADRTCTGKSVAGVGVYYRASPSFKGVDNFEYKMTAGSMARSNHISFIVEAQVTVN